MRFLNQKLTSGPRSTIALLVCAVVVLSLAGCAGKSYRAAEFGDSSFAASNPITIGQANPRLDKIEHALMAPRRWVRQLRKKPIVDVSYVRQQPIEVAMDYFAINQLSGINIDVDVYQPKLQWQRLKDADHVGPLAKYSFGLLSLVREAVLPARLFNQDRYNHYTKTLSLNSHNDASALFEAAMVKEHLEARYIGPATVVQRLPLGTTLSRLRAGSDALTFAKSIEEAELESELYPVVYSSVVSEVLGDVGTLTNVSLNFPQRIVARVGARQIGKAVGSFQQRSK